MIGIGKGNDARRVLRLCAEMEREMGGLYRDLAAAHSREPSLAALWTKTAHEEDNHARQFDLALRYGEELGGVLVSAQAVAALIEVIQEHRRRFCGSPPSPAEALRTALDLEERFAHFHMDGLAAFRSPSLRKLFESMMAADREHVETVRRALAVRG